MKIGKRRSSKRETVKPKTDAGKTSLSSSTSRKKTGERRKKKNKRSDQFVFSRRAILLWGMSFMVVAIWIFVLGVLAGRGLIFHSQTFKNIEKRIGEFRSNNPPAVTVEPDQEEGAASEPKLTFYKSLSTGRIQDDLKSIKKPESASLPSEQKKKTTATVSSGPESLPEKTPLRKKEIESSARPVAKREKPAVQSLPQGTSLAQPPARVEGENYTVQVAALKNLERAEKLVASLKRQGYPAYFYHVRDESRQYFRVRVGRYKTRREAQSALVRLRRIGHEGIFISRLTN